MAKKQTRRGVSVARSTYEAATKWAEAQNASLSSLVDAWLRQQSGLPPIIVYRGRRGRSGAEPGHALRARVAATAQIKPNDVHEASDVGRRIETGLLLVANKSDAAIDNPCRDPRCAIEALHAAHVKVAS